MINHTRRHEERWNIIFTELGRACKKCGNEYPAVVYDLHHPNGKKSRKDTPSRIIRFATNEDFLKHLKTWELLCANCHRLHHAVDGWHPARKETSRGNCIMCKQEIISDAPRIFACPGECQKKYHRQLSRDWQRRKRSGKLQTDL